MPRKAPRSHRSEELRVITRLEWELKQRKLSAEKLAEKLADAGHPINRSAIHKLIHGTPRRRLTLNEAAALADVLELSLQDLLIPQDVLLKERGNQWLRSLTEAARQLQVSLDAYQEVLSGLSAFVDDDEGEPFYEASKSVTARLQEAVEDLGRIHEDAVDRIYGMDHPTGGEGASWHP